MEGNGRITVWSAGKGHWILGGPGDDVIYGSEGPDDISGGAGNDRVWGSNGR